MQNSIIYFIFRNLSGVHDVPEILPAITFRGKARLFISPAPFPNIIS